MGQFFGSLYCLFGLDQFYGLDLANYLWGLTSSIVTNNQYIGIGLTMLSITLAMVLIYYYVLNQPRLSKWWGWGIFLVLNSIINFIVGWQWVLSDYYAGKMVYIDPATNLVTALPIYESNILCFGVVNMLLSIISFFIFSIIFKWWSRNCSTSPF